MPGASCFVRHVFIVAGLLLPAQWTTPIFAAERPNLLLFMADDMTYTDLGCYGHTDVRTPYIDALAAAGMRFTRCYNPAPMCSPLRQALFTGLYPVRNGAYPNHSQVYSGTKSLPHYLRPLGYRVAILGKRHEAPAAAFPFEMLGGSHGDGGKTPDGQDLPLNRARDFILRDPGEPWCLVVTSNQPHTPWNRGDVTAYPPETLKVPPYLVDTPALRQALARYYAEITYMDAQVGQVTAMLQETATVDNTVLVWLSEQGSQLPFGKWTCYDMGIHAAAVVRWPGVVAAGSESAALLSYVDVLPTFVELAGGDSQAPHFDGRSFVPVLKQLEAIHHDVVFSVQTTRGIYHGSEAFGIRSATDGRWLYIRNLHFGDLFQNSVTFRDPVFGSWKTLGTDFARQRVAAYVRRPAEELFDLESDPWCLQNQIHAESAQHVRRRLVASMNLWMKQQGDMGDETERSAPERQPKEKPWVKDGAYSRQISEQP